MAEPRHFLDIDRFETATLREMLDRGLAFKNGTASDPRPLQGKTLAMIFDKPSTSTRVSFQVGMHELGGEVVLISPNDSQLGRGESIADTARVLSRYVDAIMFRTDAVERLTELAECATVPVINGLTDESHPCQLMADVMTLEEHRGPIAGKTVAWCGDGNNVAASWIHAAARFEFSLKLACPEQLSPSEAVLARARAEGADVTLLRDAAAAVDGQAVHEHRVRPRRGHQVPVDLVWFQHVVPVGGVLVAHGNPGLRHDAVGAVHRGEEVTAEVIDGPQSVVWDEAENRLHAQKGILAWCIA